MIFVQFFALLFNMFHPADSPAGVRTGMWRGVLTTNGGELPFNFETKMQDGHLYFEIINGTERINADEVKVVDDSVFIKMPVFDSEFRLKYTTTSMSGLYINHSRKDKNVFPFNAEFGKAYRFTDEKIKPVANISGRWEVEFSKGTADSSRAVGIFQQSGNDLTGTFMTTSGDYRYLDGTVQGDQLFLSTFDGSHAYLFKATIDPAGRISGMYYSGNHWQELWVARHNESYELPDPYTLTYLKPGYDRFDFSFPDLTGNKVSLSDDRFKDKVVIVQIMGSWCPNCMDETAFFAPLYNRFHPKGLEIVGLAYEKTTDFEKAKQNVLRLKDRFGIEYTLSLAVFH